MNSLDKQLFVNHFKRKTGYKINLKINRIFLMDNIPSINNFNSYPMIIYQRTEST